MTINAGAPGADGGILTSNSGELVTTRSGITVWWFRAAGKGVDE